MKKYGYIIILTVIGNFSVWAQQLPHTSQFNDIRAVWNPAATAFGTEMKANLHLREQWISFNNAPRTGSAFVEYPLLDYNMSGGAGLTFDKSGPVSKIGLQLNYAYKLEGIFTRESQLSAGLSAGFSQYTFDPSSTVVNDLDDPLSITGRSSQFYPSATAGIFYISNPKMYDGDNVFFFGISYSHIYAGNILIGNYNQERNKHVFFEIGKRFQGYDSYIEPSIMFNYTNPDLITLIFSTKYELKDVFWAGIGFSSAKDLSIQGGIILPEFGSRYSYLRIGALANYGTNERASAFGLGFEALVSYVYEMD